jgi:protein-disulfide isomerase
MRMAHEKTRSIVEVIANIAIAAAAIAIVWRIVFTPAPAPQPGAAALPTQDLTPRNLSTSLSKAARRGDAAAQVVLIEYSDFGCPFCGRHARETLVQIDKEFIGTGKIQYVFRNFPVDKLHPAASHAAQAAECAGEQGKYWEMHDRLFANQPELEKQVWLREASALQMNTEAFERCMAGTMSSKVKEDMTEGSRLGVQATPTFFVGKLQKDGTVRLVKSILGAHPYTVFQESLNQALKSD